MEFKYKYPDTALFSVEKAKAMFDTTIQINIDTILNILQRNIMSEAPIGGDNQLRDTIYTKRDNLMGTVWSGVDYGIVLNEGRRPGSTPPPSSILIPWLTKYPAGIAYMASVRGTYPKASVQSIAYMLAQSIGRKGFKNPFFDRGIEKSQYDINKVAKELLEKISTGLSK